MKPAVIFDMDGVLVDSARAHLRSWEMLAEEEGLTMTPQQFKESFGRPSRDIIRLFFGQDRDDQAVRRLDDRKEALYRDLIRDHIPVMDGALALLERLRKEGMALAVGTSGPPANVDLVLKGLGLEACFAAVVTGADVTRGKPDPHVFQLAAGRLGAAPEACVVVEDAPAGIEAAHRAGMKAVALDSTHPAAAFTNADRVIHTLTDLTPEVIIGMIRPG